MTEKVYDLALVGGGATALSFAMAFAAEEKSHSSVIILEARTAYQQDRHWSFWLPVEAPFVHRDVIKKTWSSWRFSDEKQIITHYSANYHYHTIQAIDFYQKAQKIIYADPRLTLCLDYKIQEIYFSPTENNYTIKAVNGLVTKAKKIIDSRSWSAAEIQEQTSYYQIFCGYEIAFSEKVFQENSVGLMEQLQSDVSGTAFLYTLPFSPYQALVEYTLFTATFRPPASLVPFLNNYLQQKLPPGFRLLAQEMAVLPLGRLKQKAINTESYLYAGARAGALRASSGYGFLSLSAWAQAAATVYQQTGKLLPLPKENPGLAWMDQHFIKTLQLYPTTVSAIFLKIAANTTPDHYARFMRGEVSLTTLLQVLWACPKKPFFQALFA